MPVLTEKFERQEPLLVAVSGGIDSMVLLHLLLHLPKPTRPAVSVGHFNHRLRGRESDRDAHFVADLCRRGDVPLYVGEAPPWKSKSNLQSRARDLRYRFLYETARRLGIGKVATAHQANDQAETFLIRWLQGSGLKGLCGIPAVRREGDLLVVRPLLLTPREEIVAYAKRHEIPYRIDSSNGDPKYLRTKVRGLTSLLSALQPRFAGRAAVNATFLKVDEEYLERSAEEVFSKFSSREGGTVSFPTALYGGLPAALRYRILQKMAGRTLSGRHLLKVDQLILGSAPRRSYRLSGGLRFLKDYIRFEIGIAVDLKELPVVPFAV